MVPRERYAENFDRKGSLDGFLIYIYVFDKYKILSIFSKAQLHVVMSIGVFEDPGGWLIASHRTTSRNVLIAWRICIAKDEFSSSEIAWSNFMVPLELVLMPLRFNGVTMQS
jgi:hypothetical protein